MAQSIEQQSGSSLLPKILVGVALPVVALVLAITSMCTVPAGHRGVVKLFGSVQDEPLSEGLHFLNPLARVVDFNVRFQALSAAKAEGGTIDMQRVYEDLTLNYSYDPKYAPYVYNNFGDDNSIEQNFIGPAMYESFKAVTSKYTAEDLVTKRSAVSASIIALLTEKLAKYHIVVSDINVTNFHFDDAFTTAVEQKVVAAQNRLTAEQNLETSRISAQQAVVAAEGQAKAIAIQAAAIQQQGGAQYVAMKAVEKWNGQLPTQYSGASIPFVNLTAQK